MDKDFIIVQVDAKISDATVRYQCTVLGLSEYGVHLTKFRTLMLNLYFIFI
jgi:hypothetical protein